MQKVTLVDLGVIKWVYPLVCGYLEAYAKEVGKLGGEYEFEQFAAAVEEPYGDIENRLVASGADVYAFSCYGWNMGWVNKLVTTLSQAHPRAQFVLGGPQVDRSQAQYLEAGRRDLFVSSGDGEAVFTDFLKERLSRRPDYSRVPGLSYWNDGVVLCEAPSFIDDLNTIPSPYLGGYFPDGKYVFSLLETNRGCPFRCAFCFWGATRCRVNYFDEQRVLDELTWLAKHNYVTLALCDANFGIHSRDLRFAEHIAKLKKDLGCPVMLKMSTVKNKPGRIIEVASLFHQANLTTGITIALQSVTEEVATIINRRNVTFDDIDRLQRGLAGVGAGSYVELIWPLPGETLDSFEISLERLCRNRALAVFVYPLKLLNGSELMARREEYRFVTIPDPHEAAEGEFVVQSKWVTEQDFDDGLWFYLAFNLLYNGRGLYLLSRYLDESGILSYAGLFRSFVDFLKGRSGCSVADACRRNVLERNQLVTGYLHNDSLYVAHHANRADFTRALGEFVTTQPWWNPSTAAVFEVDLIARPYFYSNTPVEIPEWSFQHVKVGGARGRRIAIRVPQSVTRWVLDNIDASDLPDDWSGVALLDHARTQLPFMRQKSMQQNLYAISPAVENMTNIVPRWLAKVK